MSLLNPVELIREFAIFGLAPKVFKWIGGIFTSAATHEIGKAGAEVVTKKLKDEKRDEFHGWLCALASEPGGGYKASKTLLGRWKDRQLKRPRMYGRHERYTQLDESHFESRLVDYWTHHGAEDELEKRTQLFIRFGNMTHKDFDTELEMLGNGHMKAYWEAVDAAATPPLEALLAAIRKTPGGN